MGPLLLINTDRRAIHRQLIPSGGDVASKETALYLFRIFTDGLAITFTYRYYQY